MVKYTQQNQFLFQLKKLLTTIQENVRWLWCVMHSQRLVFHTATILSDIEVIALDWKGTK